MLPENFNSSDYYHLNKKQIEDELDYSFGDMYQTLQHHYLSYGKERGLSYSLALPEDFSVDALLEVNPELTKQFKPLGQNIKIDKAAYLASVLYQYPYKLELPSNFSVEGYRKYNNDLESLTDKELQKHYYLFGKKEGRIYSLDLPSDFCVKNYKRYNPDLVKMPDIFAEKHYCTAGSKEGRIYKLALPEDFEARMYSYMNPDLEGLNEAELEKHYFEHGCQEKREYLDPLYDAEYFTSRYSVPEEDHGYSVYIDDVRNIKSREVEEIVASLPCGEIDLLLVSHQTSFFGATHYLYALFNHIKEKYPEKTIKLAEQYADTSLTEKYGLHNEDVIVYHNDPTVLWHITEKLKPKKVLVNSASKIINPVLKYIDTSKRVLHSHEVREHYQAVIKDAVPDFVVSEKIAGQWEGYTVKVQPPFIDSSTRELLDSCEAEKTISNEYGQIDLSKLVIGMCGDLSPRKNPDLFGRLAERFKDINFVWIGGHCDFPVQNIKNLYHVKNIAKPYSYFKLFDYFLLTSIIDPCPYVVLENLYLNNNVVTFRDNIFTSHYCDNLKENYIEIPGKIAEGRAIQILDEIRHKGKRPTQNGKTYILDNFSTPTKDYMQAILN
jgi:hypothetical protein